MRGILLILFGSWLPSCLCGQAPFNGPMLGHVDHLAAKVWIQCPTHCTAQIEYWAMSRPDSMLFSEVVRSDPEAAHAVVLTMAPLVPGTRYAYRLHIDDRPVTTAGPFSFATQPLWKWRGDPPEFTVATGSCTYINEPEYDRPGKPYGGDMGIFGSIARERPDLMVWLGDNVYLREPDWGTRHGYLHRYTHTRSTPELQHLLGSTAHYAIWDDHDFGPNDADGSWWNAAVAREVFDRFWANPTSGVPGLPQAITTAFTHGDVDFFLLDGRTFRVPPNVLTDRPALLGDAQIDWLIRALRYSQAPFKIVAVGTQFLNTAAVFENHATYPEERARIIDRIDREGISGVIFLTGDRHFTELSRLDLPDGRWIHDLTCSPLTSGPYTPKEENQLRVPGTLVTERNYALLRFSGPRGSRVLTIQVKNSAGTMLWERDLDQPKRP